MSTVFPQAGKVTYIISAEREGFTPGQNAKATEWLATLLAGELAGGRIFTMAHCDGAYKGTPERSIAIVAPSGWISEAHRIGRMFDQESILRLSAAGTATLHFMEHDEAVPIGRYAAIDSTDGVEAWTQVLATGETFTFH